MIDRIIKLLGFYTIEQLERAAQIHYLSGHSVGYTEGFSAGMRGRAAAIIDDQIDLAIVATRQVKERA